MAAHAAIAVGWSVVEVCAERLCRILARATRRALMRATARADVWWLFRPLYLTVLHKQPSGDYIVLPMTTTRVELYRATGSGGTQSTTT